MNKGKLELNVVEFILKDPIKVNAVYEEIVSKGSSAFTSREVFDETVKTSIDIYLSYKDYLHSNNIIQVYKSEFPNAIIIGWFLFYVIKVYGHRNPSFYLNNPKLFWDRISLLIEQEYDFDRIDLLITSFIKNATETIDINNYAYLQDLLSFCSYYLNNKINYSEGVSKAIVKIKHEYNQSIKESRSFRTDIFTFVKNDDTTKNEHVIEIDQKLELDSNEVKIIVIGKSNIEINHIQGIARNFGIIKDQIEIYNDYERIKGKDFGYLQYNPKYIGIIIGPVPHSSTTNGEYNSIVSRFENDQGFPFLVKAEVNKQLKITRTSIKSAFERIVINYLNNKKI